MKVHHVNEVVLLPATPDYYYVIAHKCAGSRLVAFIVFPASNALAAAGRVSTLLVHIVVDIVG